MGTFRDRLALKREWDAIRAREEQRTEYRRRKLEGTSVRMEQAEDARGRFPELDAGLLATLQAAKADALAAMEEWDTADAEATELAALLVDDGRVDDPIMINPDPTRDQTVTEPETAGEIAAKVREITYWYDETGRTPAEMEMAWELTRVEARLETLRYLYRILDQGLVTVDQASDATQSEEQRNWDIHWNFIYRDWFFALCNQHDAPRAIGTDSYFDFMQLRFTRALVRCYGRIQRPETLIRELFEREGYDPRYVPARATMLAFAERADRDGPWTDDQYLSEFFWEVGAAGRKTVGYLMEVYENLVRDSLIENDIALDEYPFVTRAVPAWAKPQHQLKTQLRLFSEEAPAVKRAIEDQMKLEEGMRLYEAGKSIREAAKISGIGRPTLAAALKARQQVRGSGQTLNGQVKRGKEMYRNAAD